MNDRISSLRLFSRVARSGNFTRAGRETGLSQPSVSRIIATLEKDLGATLFVRSTHAVTLTDAGTEYLDRVEAILADLEAADHAVRGTGELRGQLRIGAATSFAMREIVPRLPAFMEQHPELRVDLALTDSRQNLVSEAIDVAIRFGALSDSTLMARKLGAPPRILAASPAYLKRFGTPQSPADLTAHRAVVGPSSSGSSAWKFKKDGKVTSVQVDGRLSVSVNEASTAAALAGIGIVSMVTWGCRRELAAGDLVRLLPEWDLGSVEVHAVLAGANRAKPAARAFVGYLRVALNQLDTSVSRKTG